MLPPAGQIFEKWHLLKVFDDYPMFLNLSSRVLAGVLPPAGQIFEKWHPLENVERFSEVLLQFSSKVPGVLTLAPPP